MILTCIKDACEDLIHNTIFNSYFFKLQDFCNTFQKVAKIYKDSLKFLLSYVAAKSIYG